MGIQRLIPVIFTAVLLAGSARAADKVAVMNLRALDGVDSFLPPLINELFCAKIPEYGDYETITGPFIQEKIDASGNQQLMSCNSTDCYYLIGGGFEAKLLVAGTIGMQGDAYIINMVLLDVPNERVTRNLVRRYEGDQFGIVDELEVYLRQLFGVEPAGPDAEAPASMLVAVEALPEPSYDELMDEVEEGTAEAEDISSVTGMPGTGAMFRMCEDEGREIIAGGGYSLVNLGEFGAFDVAKIGYRNKRNVFILQVKMNETTGSGFSTSLQDERLDTTTTVMGGGILYGYRLCHLFNDWVTITPGASAGYYKYVQDIDVFYNYTGPWVLDEVNSAYYETIAFFGAGLQVDIGKQVSDRLAVYGYTHAQLLWVKDPIFFLDFGLRIGYLLP